MSYDNMYTSEQVVRYLRAKREEYSKAPPGSHGSAPAAVPTSTQPLAAPLTTTQNEVPAPKDDTPTDPLWSIVLAGTLFAASLLIQFRTRN